MEIKDYLYNLRKNKEISAYKLAKEIGISRTTILGYENGTIEPTVKNANKILVYLEGKYVIGSNLEKDNITKK